ncbi:RDD family protein [Sulfuriroseicoccus oceanibius]|uniref:RDD family protein n=1 Tax=Sulfuriroseicoccus oceanibius TaxID=2707525 RepID=A0A6B3LFW0_9BACT|nr:RDD family protein [Sulfuriroseicoccus oceanibius]QQL45377.1 RDD family protein [Sulfuriroseicoccus oceanibius]
MPDAEKPKCSTWNPYHAPAASPNEEVVDAFHQASFNQAGMTGRFAHFLLDGMLWLILNAVVHANAESLGIDLFKSGPMGFLLTLIVFFLYFAGLEFCVGRTIGQAYTRSRVVNHEGKRITLRQALLRTSIRLIPLDQLSIFADQKSTWHDLASKTKVVTKRH